MPISPWIEQPYYRLCDAISATVPRRLKHKDLARHCEVISHRGEYDNRTVFENTIAAFDPIVEKGIAGFECDIRFTQDAVPVIAHDLNCQRVYHNPVRIQDLTFEQLRERLPLIPSLAELVARYAGKCHMMLELKSADHVTPEMVNQRLAEILSPLTPGEDYHFISLNPTYLSYVTFVPKSCLVPIAGLFVGSFCDLIESAGYHAMMGHYSLVRKKHIKQLHEQGHSVGTGQINSRFCLYRELNRGVHWIFSDNAVKIQSILNELLNHHVKDRRCCSHDG